jgi:CrcB protein
VPWSTALRALPSPKLAAVVAVGGSVGAVARYLVETALPAGKESWPLTTFIINMKGALIIGVLVGLLVRMQERGRTSPPWLRPLLVTGFLGGYTTFSSYMVETYGRLAIGDTRGFVVGITYWLGSAVAGVVLVLIGLSLGEFSAPRDTETSEDTDLG